MSFEPLGLAPELLHAVAAQGYTEPTPVQAESIPLVLAGRDVLAGAQTGTGKTAAFVLPILQLLNASRPQSNRPAVWSDRRGGASGPTIRPSGLPIRCLILSPTRELALQIEESVRTYGAVRPIRSTTIYGGVGFDPQVRALRAGPEIVVATPGRLLDHAGQGTIDLRSVEILVLDEADRMLDMGFIRDIRRILELLPAQRQNLLFSATFSDEIRDLAAAFLSEPAYVQIARRNAPIELVRQVVYPVDRGRKTELLTRLIRSRRIDRALIFTRTKHGANRLAEHLQHDGIAAAAIHGNKSQGQRVRALDDFKAGRVSFLVATEIAARGLDIDGLPHVVNFELPMVASDYVHRIGRTGRAGMEGDAVSLVCVDELGLLRDIETLLRTPIRRETVAGFEVDRSIRPEPLRQRSNGMGRPVMAPRRPPVAQPVGRPAGAGRAAGDDAQRQGRAPQWAAQPVNSPREPQRTAPREPQRTAPREPQRDQQRGPQGDRQREPQRWPQRPTPARGPVGAPNHAPAARNPAPAALNRAPSAPNRGPAAANRGPVPAPAARPATAGRPSADRYRADRAAVPGTSIGYVPAGASRGANRTRRRHR